MIQLLFQSNLSMFFQQESIKKENKKKWMKKKPWPDLF